jgi:hypothetical protein
MAVRFLRLVLISQQGSKRKKSMKRKKSQRKVSDSGRYHLSTKEKFIQPRNLEEFLAMPNRYQELWGDIGQIVTDVREGKTLAEAARTFHRSPRTVRRLAGSVLTKGSNGRWAVKKRDRLLRILQMLNRKGRFEVAIRDSRYATLISKYWHAVELYRDTGDSSSILRFHGKYVIDADGHRVPFLTDLREIDRLGSAGVLSFETLYARVA